MLCRLVGGGGHNEIALGVHALQVDLKKHETRSLTFHPLLRVVLRGGAKPRLDYGTT